MKKALTIFALLISGVAGGQNNPWNINGSQKFNIDTSKHLKIGIRTVVPLHMFVIAGENTTLNLDFKGDSLVVSGNMKLSESGKIFIDFCRKYMKTKIDSLEIELKKCKEIFLNQKVEYIPRMGNSSIYDTIPGAGYIRVSDENGNPVWKKPIVKPDIFQMLLDYEKECAKDTITIVQYEYKSDFLFKQMEDKGYKRFSGHFYGTNPFRYEHYYVKEATLKGFIQWYKEKMK